MFTLKDHVLKILGEQLDSLMATNPMLADQKVLSQDLPLVKGLTNFAVDVTLREVPGDVEGPYTHCNMLEISLSVPVAPAERDVELATV